MPCERDQAIAEAAHLITQAVPDLRALVELLALAGATRLLGALPLQASSPQLSGPRTRALELAAEQIESSLPETNELISLLESGGCDQLAAVLRARLTQNGRAGSSP
jgi:hypothetical protein